ncbi:general substrate transporter [Aspergillus keveii]|uniref:General substrate transporter n=1 Tax=Aspergillus keveii TaxID=714993 RepID=A0ABR4FN48_9EURO
MFGYDTIVNGASISMPSFLLYFGEQDGSTLYLPSIWTSLWTAMSALAQAISATGTGYLADRIGRKWSGCIAGVISIAGASVQFTAHTRGALLAGKIVSGFGIGMAITSAMVYASEIVPPRLAPVVQQAMVVFILVMQGVAMGVIRVFVPDMAPSAFRTVLGIQWGVGGLVALAFLFAPESPVYLITSAHEDRAKKLFTLLYRDPHDCASRYTHLVQTIEKEKTLHALTTNKATFAECFRGTNMKRTLTMMFLFSLVNLGGAPFLSQSIYFLTSVGLPVIHVFDISIGGFGLAVVIIIASGIVLKKVRRRTTVLVGCAVNLVVNLIIGVLYYPKGQGPKWGIAVLMNVLISLQSSLLQAPGWSIASEISSYRLRAKSMSLGLMAQTFTTWLITFIVPYMYNVDSGNLGARTGLVFAGVSVLLTWGAWVLVPDLEGLSTEDVDVLYQDKTPVRRFKESKRGAGSAESAGEVDGDAGSV